MRKHIPRNGVYRIIDANINRVKEGLRVCEEINRFILNDPRLSSAFKRLRHKIDAAVKNLPATAELFKSREVLRDIGKATSTSEIKRRDPKDIFFANIQRAKESLRVLEEFSKLLVVDAALDFKKIRYAIYELEKRIAQKMLSLRYLG